jgi:hypothetical protein
MRSKFVMIRTDVFHPTQPATIITAPAPLKCSVSTSPSFITLTYCTAHPVICLNCFKKSYPTPVFKMLNYGTGSGILIWEFFRCTGIREVHGTVTGTLWFFDCRRHGEP